MKRTPLRAKREKPRRNEGRVTHERMRPKVGALPSAEERRYLAWVATLPCLVCGAPSTVHHVTATVHGGRISRSHKRVVPLCPRHHQVQWGPKESVEALGHRGFHLTHGLDLMREATRLWVRWKEPY